MTRARSLKDISRAAQHAALLDAAEAWDALAPEERHLFARQYANTIKVSSLPSAWLRVRASRLLEQR